MKRKFKHKLTNKILVIGGKTGESMLKYISSKYDGITISEIITNSNEWEEVVDKNPLKLEVGKTYKLQYKHCKSPIRTCKITRFTTDGYPWMECPDYRGIVSPDCYNLIEEVIEKNYEILSFSKNTSSYNIYMVRENGRLLWDIPEYKNINADSTATHWTEAINKGYNIHSIKRLSDGEIFTVGDNTNKGKILSIKIEGKGLVFNGSYDFGLKSLVKSKVLFRTEDGVNIFEGDEFWYVTTKGFNLWTKTCDSMSGAWAVNAKRVGDIPFSTREAAEEYILMNKPCLSWKDVLKLTHKNGVNNITQTYKTKKLRDLVKEKAL